MSKTFVILNYAYYENMKNYTDITSCINFMLTKQFYELFREGYNNLEPTHNFTHGSKSLLKFHGLESSVIICYTLCVGSACSICRKLQQHRIIGCYKLDPSFLKHFTEGAIINFKPSCI
jgi:hypothetical protein